jgi:hypothetical protein
MGINGTVTPFCSNIIKQDLFLHVVHFLHFVDNRKELDKNDENCNRLLKMQDVFEMINVAYVKYNVLECLAIDKVIILFTGRVVFKHYIKHRHTFWHQHFQIVLFDYTYDMKVCIGRYSYACK